MLLHCIGNICKISKIFVVSVYELRSSWWLIKKAVDYVFGFEIMTSAKRKIVMALDSWPL